MINKEKAMSLLEKAIKVRDNAYAPYSNFHVGAALLCEDGEIFVGANVENASYGGAICAERVAFTSAVAAGKRKFSAIAIVGAPADKTPDAPCFPCGFCRQVMSEFCSADFEIIVSAPEGFRSYTMAEILPHSFSSDML